MPPHKRETRESRYSIRDFEPYLIPVGGIIVFFLITIVAANSQRTLSKIVYGVSRDVGIGFVVALIVTMTYEMYARGRYERRSFVSTLSVIMNEIIHPGVWEEVRTQIVDRRMIRKHCTIRLKLENEANLLSGQMVLRVELEYELHNLSSKPEPVTISHYLDDHIECKAKHLPRFEQVEIIGKENFFGASLKRQIHNGVFSYDTTLKPRGESDIQVRTVRREITYVPGSYNLIMGEICLGLKILLEEIPSGIEPFVHVWPHTKKPIRLKAGETLDDFHDKILLPGQGCEFRFH